MLFAVGGEIMDTVSGFELDDMKIYRIRKIEIMSSEFWSKDEYLMYFVDEESWCHDLKELAKIARIESQAA